MAPPAICPALAEFEESDDVVAVVVDAEASEVVAIEVAGPIVVLPGVGVTELVIDDKDDEYEDRGRDEDDEGDAMKDEDDCVGDGVGIARVGE